MDSSKEYIRCRKSFVYRIYYRVKNFVFKKKKRKSYIELVLDNKNFDQECKNKLIDGYIKDLEDQLNKLRDYNEQLVQKYIKLNLAIKDLKVKNNRAHFDKDVTSEYFDK